MLKLAISYVGNGVHEMPILESVSSRTIAGVARGVISEYLQAANDCGDTVLATLLRSEAYQAREILRAAGVDVESERADTEREEVRHAN